MTEKKTNSRDCATHEKQKSDGSSSLEERKRKPMARDKTALRKIVALSIRFLDRSTRHSLRLRHALLSLARKLGVHHRVVRFYQFARLQQAANAHKGRVFELSESQKRAQSAWLPVARKLEVDELLSRIRRELQSSSRSGGEA